MQSKPLATTTTRKRFRYKNYLDVESDFVAQAGDVRAGHESQAMPSAGVSGCFFSEELDRQRALDISGPFRRFYAQVSPLSRTLPQLVHHRDAVVDALVGALSARSSPTEPTLCWPALCALTGTLARDLRGELYPRYNDLMGALRTLIDPARPEVTASAFRTVSFLFKYLSPCLAGDPAALTARVEEWTGYLGSRRMGLRDLTAASLSLLLRKLPLGGQRGQVLGMLRSVAGGGATPPPLATLATLEDIASAVAMGERTTVLGRGVDMKDGVARLLFQCIKGPAGSLHSRGETILTACLGTLGHKRSVVEGACATAGVGGSGRGGGSGSGSISSRRRSSSIA